MPFPVESALSGIERHEDHMFYRRTFTVPAGWSRHGQRLQLHFGAVDWQATVWVNGMQVGTHRAATTRSASTSPTRSTAAPRS